MKPVTNKIFLVFAAFILLLAGACKKEQAVPARQSIKTKTIDEAAALKVHAAVRRLESLGAGRYNYELSNWVTTTADTLTALVLPGVLHLTGTLNSGANSVSTSTDLQAGSCITRKIYALASPVAVTGKFSTPGSYQEHSIVCSGTVTETAYNLLPIKVQGTGFVDANGRPFIPWGLNYTNTIKLPLVDDGIDNDTWATSWEIIKKDFRQMRQMDINLVRIHLEYNRFMTAPDKPNPLALSRLKDMVVFAGQNGLYIDVTGLACYRAADTPPWYDVLDETTRWQSQAVFWAAIANTLAGVNNVFCYNLINEPVVPSASTTTWLPGSPFGGYNFVQNLTREPAGRSWQTVTHAWIKTMRDAIRKNDARTPITIGFIGLGVTSLFNDVLDYNSMHIYPSTGQVPAAIATVNGDVTAKPLIVEETAPLSAGYSDMELFFSSTRQAVAGYLCHYQGETIDQLLKDNTLSSAIQGDWLIIFTRQQLSPVYNKPYGE